MPENVITKDFIAGELAGDKRFDAVPRVAVPIITMADDSKASISSLADIIEADPDLSKRILGIANSSSYGFRRKITSISHAVVLLGWNAIKMIALGSTILTRMSAQDPRLLNHSMLTAQIARFLATEANFYKVEEIAVVGLLHDIGTIVLEAFLPDRCAEVRQETINRGVPGFIAERELLGVDHGVVGGWTLETWNMPGNIVESVARHHSFDPSSYHARKTAVIHVADVFALAADYRGPSWEKVPAVSEQALDILGFTNSELKDFLIAIMKMKLKPLIV